MVHIAKVFMACEKREALVLLEKFNNISLDKDASGGSLVEKDKLI